MEENRFFRTVWRINGVALTLMLIIIGGIALYTFIEQLVRDKQPVIIKNVADDPDNEENWQLGGMQEIAGVDYVYLPLVSDNKNVKAKERGFSPALHGYGSSSYHFSLSRNILFINKKTREMHWLFNGNKQLIENIDMLSAKPEHEPKRNTVAILYHVINKDTNSNKILDEGDLADIAISRPSGRDYKVIFPAVERVIGAMPINDGEALVLYQSHGKGFTSTVRLKDLSVSKPREMPKTSASP